MNHNLSKCMEMLLAHEGGYVDHPDDPGGATNLGVTKKVWENYVGHEVTKDDMKALTVEQVTPLYKIKYWDKVKGDELPSGVDWAVFDWGVNSGVGRSSKALQSIVGVTADGAIGPMTLAAVANKPANEIVEEMHKIRQDFYESLSTFETFGRGWTRRNDETKHQALEMI